MDVYIAVQRVQGRLQAARPGGDYKNCGNDYVLTWESPGAQGRKQEFDTIFRFPHTQTVRLHMNQPEPMSLLDLLLCWDNISDATIRKNRGTGKSVGAVPICDLCDLSSCWLSRSAEPEGLARQSALLAKARARATGNRHGGQASAPIASCIRHPKSSAIIPTMSAA